MDISDTRTGRERSRQMLRTALGPHLLARLDDPGVGEVLLNPDGRVWVDRFDVGLVNSGLTIASGDAERIVRLVAHHVAAEIHAERPRLSAELPDGGERFEGLMPPLVAAPSFSIRKPASLVFRLEDYVQSGVMTEREGQVLAHAVQARKNVLVVGQTSSGKTTLVNALLAEVALSGDRVVLLEDLRELQCPAADQVAVRTREGVATLTDLVRSALRLRPDRIIIGEVRGPEALDLIKAWGTGHPGGVATLHAGSALGALLRLEQLIQEAVVTVPRGLIAETIDVIAVLSGRGRQRRLIEIVRLEGLAPDGAYQLSPA